VLQASGAVDPDGNVTPIGEAAGVKKECTGQPAPGASNCGYYQFLQGTSMAAPHASGVAALAVSAHGGSLAGGFGMDPIKVRALLIDSAINHACPPGGIQTYTNEGRPDEFTAVCVGGPEFNGFYGGGIANAMGAVR
jgi:subtilisin family serine protease